MLRALCVLPNGRLVVANLLLAALAAAYATAEGVSPRGEVIKLTDDNFDEVTADTSTPWFVAVTAPWCTHCQDLKPIWRTLAAQMKGQVHVGEVIHPHPYPENIPMHMPCESVPSRPAGSTEFLWHSPRERHQRLQRRRRRASNDKCILASLGDRLLHRTRATRVLANLSRHVASDQCASAAPAIQSRGARGGVLTPPSRKTLS